MRHTHIVFLEVDYLDFNYIPDMQMGKCVNLLRRSFVSVKIMELFTLEKQKKPGIPLCLLTQRRKNSLYW